MEKTGFSLVEKTGGWSVEGMARAEARSEEHTLHSLWGLVIHCGLVPYILLIGSLKQVKQPESQGGGQSAALCFPQEGPLRVASFQAAELRWDVGGCQPAVVLDFV